MFNDLNTLHKLIKEYCVGKDEEGWNKKNKDIIKESTKDEGADKEDEEHEETNDNQELET